MSDFVYSIKITLESVEVRDPDDGDVYFIAHVNRQSKGRSKVFDMRPGDTADMRPLGWSWEVRVLGAPGAIPIELQAWDKDWLSGDDDLGKVVTVASGPWKSQVVTATSANGNLKLTYSVAATIISITGANVALVSRQHDGSTYVSTLAKPNVAVATFTEILGLNKPGVDNRPPPIPPGTTRGADYVAGYTSDDDKGRVFINREPGGSWVKGTQYIELTAVVEPATVTLPPGATMVWAFEDPDDPSNEPPTVYPDAGKILDPNDYTGAVKTGAVVGDNDPSGKRKASPRFEEIDPTYALSGNETLIDAITRTTKVRFHVSDIAGDNYKVRATVKKVPPLDLSVPAETGVMTVWNRIDVEYVRMASAVELPADQISAHYALACAQVDVSLKRVVPDLLQMGLDEGAARAMCDSYVTKSSGEFSKEGEKGWFFLAAANRFLPSKVTRVLYEDKATAHGDKVKLLPGKLKGGKPAVVRIFNPAKIVGMAKPKPNDHSLHIKFRVLGKTGNDLSLLPHDFHQVDDPDNAFLMADLADYGFAFGDVIDVQVMSEGDEALITSGISPGGVDIGGKHYFGGRLIVFTKAGGALIQVLCHELCHAFDNAHKCGNWDWQKKADRTACCMCYWFELVLDDAAPRRPIAWTQNRAGPDLCAHHIRHMRDYHLEDNPGLGW
jgi:hypothetical protein